MAAPFLTQTNDPIAKGLITSFARPGGNATGVTDLDLEVTVAADQFSLCASLREALVQTGGGELPTWLERIIARGQADVADERFNSVDELVRELGRDPRTIWSRRIAIAAASVAVA